MKPILEKTLVPSECHPLTRRKLRSLISEWRRNIYNERRTHSVRWLLGPPGTGKSAIASTIVAEARKDEQPCAAYFFGHSSSPDRPLDVIPSLSNELSKQIPAYERIVADRLSVDPRILQKIVQTQFKELIAEPLQLVHAQNPFHHPVVIILDGIDQCPEKEAQRNFIRLLGNHNGSRKEMDIPLLWLVTSRPEWHLKQMLDYGGISNKCDRYHVVNDDEETLQGDVYTVIQDGLEDIKQKVKPGSVPKEWPSKAYIRKLAESSSPLFSVAMSALQFIGSEERYKALLQKTGAEAQQILNILDAVLSSPLNVVNDAARPRIVKTLSRLSTSSRRYPRQLILQGIETENSELGSGAYGVVSKGTYKGNQICVKMGRSQGNDKRNDAMVKVFLREAVLWSHLLHPNVLPLYGIFQPNNQGAIGLVSPWMPNGNMLEYLEKNPNTPRMPLIHDVLAGLIYLHQHHVVHGDLKGVNILIDDGGTACLADFGLSTLIDPIGTVSTLPGGKGTYRWMAPEAFTGQIPFHDLTQATLLRRLSNPSQYKPDRPNKTAAPELTDGIWHIMQDCWSKDPSRRPEVGTVIQRLAGLGFSPSPRALTASRRYGELPLVRSGSGVHGFNLLAAGYPKIMISR
ncbi:Serine/threonine-protein kinase HT1 [Leucoagaricus sp. SymC.cos]|nr:Serine/threonine-protein kinase HT1 [Leucoagaricus sp. SymC.cos]